MCAARAAARRAAAGAGPTAMGQLAAGRAAAGAAGPAATVGQPAVGRAAAGACGGAAVSRRGQPPAEQLRTGQLGGRAGCLGRAASRSPSGCGRWLCWGPCRQPGSGSRQPSGCRQPGSGSCQPSGCGPGWPGRPWKRGPWQNSHVGGGGTEYVGWWRRGGGQSIYVGQGPAVVYPCLCVAGSRLRRLTAPTQPLSDRLPARPELLRGRRWQYVGWWRDG